MKAKFTIKNYRCFEDTQPLIFDFEDGFTAFVGSNNSGKSSVLKFFYEFRNVWNLLSDPGILVSLFNNDSRNIQFIDVYDQTEVFCNLNERDLNIDIEFLNKENLSHINGVQVVISRKLVCYTHPKKDGKIISEAQIKNFKVRNKNFVLTDDHGIYVADYTSIPDFFKLLSQSMYIGAFRNTINVGKGSYYDIKVGTDFIETWHQWKTGSEKKLNNIIKKVSDDIKNIFGYSSLEISAAKESNTLQIYTNKNSYKLNELGAGIAQFIIVLGSVAIKQPSYILIDEPELNLHPSLQLDFLTSLASYARNGVFFATHSIGLARSVAERIYSLQQDEHGKSKIALFEQTANYTEFLGELSFSSFKELGFEKILLVEGVHDIKMIQQFLRFLKKDHKIILLPLGGSQMINGAEVVKYALNEVKRISNANNIKILIDSERKQEDDPLSGDRAAFCEVCKELGIEVHVLKRRAIENYLTKEAVQKIKGNKYIALEPYQKLEDTSLAWAKHENWRIAREMNLNEIEDTDLGEFLKSL